MTGLFEFTCLAVFASFGPFPSFSDGERALAAHAQTCDECALTGAYVEPQKVPTSSVVVPASVAELMLSREELGRNMYKAAAPVVDADELLGRALIVGALLPVADEGALAERVRQVAELALNARRAGRRIMWE